MPKPEREFIRNVRRLSSAAAAHLPKGIGDDCAVLDLPRGHEALVTTDFSLEGIHFRRDWHAPDVVGHRCLTRGLSDIAAMGGTPVAVFLSLALPPELDEQWADGFLRGLLKLARQHGVPLAGGDTAQSPAGVMADITVIGSVPKGKAVLRSGARVGDDIYVTGLLGGATSVLRALRETDRRGTGSRPTASSGRTPQALATKKRPATNARANASRARSITSAAPLTSDGLDSVSRTSRRAHFYPQPRVSVGRFLRDEKIATAMIDISDGLSVDLAHICEESGVGAWVAEKAIPHPPDAILEDALHGGDDYELLFTARPQSHDRIPATIDGVPITYIGTIVKGNGIWIVDPEMKSRRPLEPRGWQHFDF